MNYIFSFSNSIGHSGIVQVIHLWGGSTSHSTTSQIMFIPSLSHQFLKSGIKLEIVFPMIESCHKLIFLPLPGTQCKYSWNFGNAFWQRVKIGEPCLVLGALSKHLSRFPTKYFFHVTLLLQDGFQSTRLQSNLAPIARFWNFKSFIWRPPYSQGSLIVFQLTREKKFPSPFFRPCQRKILNIF